MALEGSDGLSHLAFGIVQLVVEVGSQIGVACSGIAEQMPEDLQDLFKRPLQRVRADDGAERGRELLQWWPEAADQDLPILQVTDGAFDGGADRGDGGVEVLVVHGQLSSGRFADRMNSGMALISLVANPVVACDRLDQARGSDGVGVVPGAGRRRTDCG
ncbi:MAG TPA: hypothetical protein VGS97_07970 [Actinocrinis sp.]|nr:hypothetical protein [Actinocrinis sp.]HEV2344014.1 hypothetical protein [Actinocrinis sp.]